MRTLAGLSLCGVVLLHALPELPSPMVWIVAVAVLCSFREARIARALLVFSLAFTVAWLHADARLRNRLASIPTQVHARVEASVVSLPETLTGRQRFVVDIERANIAGLLGRRARLSWFDAPVTVLPGDRWRLDVRLRAPRGLSNPHVPDFEARLFRQGIDAIGYVVPGQDNLRVTGVGRFAPINHARARLSARLGQALGQRPATGIIQALVVGDRRGLSQSVWDTLAATGTGHLIAISGLHIGLVATVVFALARRLCRRMPGAAGGDGALLTAALLAALAAATYAALAGFSVPTRRALVMVFFTLYAVVKQRPVQLTQGLALAMLVTLCLSPVDVLSAGFWLSFGAVAAIAARSGARQPAGPRGFVRAQWSVTLGLAPLLASVFGRISLVAPAANAVFVPLYSLLIIPLALAASMTLLLSGPMATPVLAGTAWLIESSFKWVDWLASLSWAELRVAGRPVWIGACGLVGAVLLLAPRGFGFRCAGAALWLPLLVFRADTLPSGAFALTLLDTGQGLSVVIATRGHSLLYDAGPRHRSGSDAGQLIVLPYFAAVRPQGPDLLIVSHADSDHAGGAGSVLTRYPDLQLLVGGDLRATHPAGRHCVAGQRWNWDGVSFEIVHPPADPALADNDASCVLAVSTGGTRVLLTGDIERKAEHLMLAQGARIDARIVIAPHHGSATSSTPGFVYATGARHVLFAVGYGNRWGFPKPRVVARWREAGAAAIDSASAGAITFRVSSDGVIGQIRRHRCAGRRLWTLPGFGPDQPAAANETVTASRVFAAKSCQTGH